MVQLIYFSRAGENYCHGRVQNLSLGNTAVLAQKIGEKLHVVPEELQPAQPYPQNYQAMTALAKLENNGAAAPALQSEIILAERAVIFLGYPIWWGSFPKIVTNFLAAHDFTGTTIYPFCTHEGSGFGTSLTDLQKLCPQAVIKQGLSVQGTRASKSAAAVTNWLSQYYYSQEGQQ